MGTSTKRGLKDGAYYCYCAYVLRIARYSGFLWVMLTNTGIYLRGLKLYGKSRKSFIFWRFLEILLLNYL